MHPFDITGGNVPRVFQMRGTCNNYPWGKLGRNSLAARLCEKTPGTSFEINDAEHYSEMWFGDYPDFPGRELKTGETLAALLEKNKQKLLGANVIQKLDGQLPFLPKILSIAKALPLQIHPNKELASQLHQEKPDQYTDPNHKPEIAVALSKFEVFAGWKPIDKISVLFNIPSLRRFVPGETHQWSDETIRAVVRNMLHAEEQVVRQVELDLAQQTGSALDEFGGQGYILDLLPRLQEEYSATDPGSLVALLCMNYLVLEPGEALFIPADGIHAYLSGDIIECMARSNNVLNTGFCPAVDRDNIDLFAKTLTFAATTKADNVRLPAKACTDGRNGHATVYQPPISEFDMLCIEIGADEVENLSSQDGPAVAIVTKGKGTLIENDQEITLDEGYIFYIAPDMPTVWRTSSFLQVYAVVVRSGSQ